MLSVQQRPDGLADQLARRRDAALGLPPLICGCRDPLDPVHQDGRCRFGPRCPYFPGRRCTCLDRWSALCPWIGSAA